MRAKLAVLLALVTLFSLGGIVDALAPFAMVGAAFGALCFLAFGDVLIDAVVGPPTSRREALDARPAPTRSGLSSGGRGHVRPSHGRRTRALPDARPGLSSRGQWF